MCASWAAPRSGPGRREPTRAYEPCWTKIPRPAADTATHRSSSPGDPGRSCRTVRTGLRASPKKAAPAAPLESARLRRPSPAQADEKQDDDPEEAEDARNEDALGRSPVWRRQRDAGGED